MDASARYLALLNTEDHLILQVLQEKGDLLEQGLKDLVATEREIAKTLPFAYLPKFGFLSSALNLTGTGLNIHAYLHLPALRHNQTLLDVLDQHQREEVCVHAWKGDLSTPIGDIIQLENRHALGLSEENIVQTLGSSAKRISAEEAKLRKKFKEEPPPAVKDLISKAFGFLSYAYALSSTEALEAWSLVQLGFDLGWLQGGCPEKMSALFLGVQRGHILCSLHDQPISRAPTGPDEARAFLIRESLSECKWTLD